MAVVSVYACMGMDWNGNKGGTRYKSTVCLASEHDLSQVIQWQLRGNEPF